MNEAKIARQIARRWQVGCCRDRLTALMRHQADEQEWKQSKEWVENMMKKREAEDRDMIKKEMKRLTKLDKRSER